MPISVERGPEFTVHSEEVEVPADLTRLGIRAVEKEFKTPVTNDRGQPLVVSPTSQKVTIQLPATRGQLASWSKGPISSSLTWFAAFWLRMIKKAIRFGWNLISGT
jgi:hypothetical protein